MKIIRISQQAQPQMTPEQIESQKTIQGATSEIMQAIALINKSLNTLLVNQTENLFKKDELINAIQNGDIRKLDQNKVNQSLEAMASISQGSLAINQALREIENEGGNINEVLQMTVTSLKSGNYSSFTQSMPSFQSNLTGMTGTTQHSVTENAY